LIEVVIALILLAGLMTVCADIWLNWWLPRKAAVRRR
jgi:hypothetical protein